ncbi:MULTISPECIES: hypothetical protein [unclassified Streptomyces]|uniref:hypothetical protein n=1 Tax=unclassified Streptomyces TaxID=2593676 RepID=UPI00081D8653|nr:MULTISPECIES: hypothetical protein [unclassified Streptomyces]MYR93112.1 hypothetical protein [Streptomyces sp. SID4937]SCD46604.1 PEP-CTERM protein-sorting domain-containing protein [Streptomyces sp. ScaeMP-e83]
MEPSSWLGLLAVLITTLGTVWGTWLGRTRTTVQEIPTEGMAPAPVQPEGTWTVSPEMYRWFQDQMAGLHSRLRALEDAEREARTRADRTDRLLGLALDHISQQDARLTAAGMPLIPMDPELVAARDAR